MHGVSQPVYTDLEIGPWGTFANILTAGAAADITEAVSGSSSSRDPTKVALCGGNRRNLTR